MAIPTVFHPILPQDITLTPFKVHKRYTLTGANLTDSSSGYLIWNAVHTNLITPVGSEKAKNDPTNSFDGSYQHIIWNSIHTRYYNDSFDPTKTFEHSNKRYTYKFLNYSASILSIPYLDCGEAIKPGSVELQQTIFALSDDKNGNLYDPSIDTGSFVPRQNLVAYWGFNDIFQRFKYREGILLKSSIPYQSNQYSVDRNSFVENVVFEQGVNINSNPTGMSAMFVGSDSKIITEHKDQFNFDISEDFTISFWVKTNVSDYQRLISKRDIIEKQEYGQLNKYQNDLVVNTLHYSSSFIAETTPIYPFDVYMDNGKIVTGISNGITTKQISGSNDISDDLWHHVAVVKSNKVLYLYVDSNLDSQTNVNLDYGLNKHSLVFGNGFVGYLDEIRIYDIAATSEQVTVLGRNTNQSLYQTAVCGNVFYRRGNIVISGFDPKYLSAFVGDWTLNYRGTHTIYQREMMIRIPKGACNLSQNPTVLKNLKSDLLIDDMVSGSLYPYATTIGFYDDQQNLLAIAKMNQPIQMRDDTVINIITRMDM